MPLSTLIPLAEARCAIVPNGLRESLRTYPQRYALMLAERPLFLWLYREDAEPDNTTVTRKAMAALVAADMATAIVVLIAVNKKGLIARVAHFPIAAPEVVDDDFRTEVEAMRGRIAKPVPPHRTPVHAEPQQRLGRNEPCWCGSGSSTSDVMGSERCQVPLFVSSRRKHNSR